jgi:hypothetical protein
MGGSKHCNPELHFQKETKAFYGKMKGQNVKRKGTMFALFYLYTLMTDSLCLK